MLTRSTQRKFNIFVRASRKRDTSTRLWKAKSGNCGRRRRLPRCVRPFLTFFNAHKLVQFKLESLTQQLQLSQSEAERTSAELTAKSEEYSKHRRTKHAELVTLQANFDALTQTYASTQATLKALQSTHTAQTHQLTQALARVQDLTGQLADQEATYASEAKNLRRLVDMMEEREIKAKQVVDNIERDWADVGDKADRREAVLRDEVQRERRAREEAESRTERLEEVLERMGRGDLPVPGPRALDLTTDGLMGLSPTVAMVSKAQKSGKTFTEVYADYVRLQDEFAKKCAEYERMDQTLSAVLAQLEERVRDECYLDYYLLNLYRHRFYPSNARNTSACSPRLPTSPRSSPKHWLTATPKQPSPKRTRRNWRVPHARTTSSNNSSPTLGGRSKTSSVRLAAGTTRRYPRTRTLRCSRPRPRRPSTA